MAYSGDHYDIQVLSALNDSHSVLCLVRFIPTRHAESQYLAPAEHIKRFSSLFPLSEGDENHPLQFFSITFV